MTEPENLILKMLQDMRGEMKIMRNEIQSIRSNVHAMRLSLEAMRLDQDILRAEFRALRDEIPVLIHLEVGNAMRPFMDRLDKLESANQ